MTFQQLRYFIAVSKYHNFHQAAKHLYVSQPAVSNQISQLEKELDVKLFDRSQKNVVLTTAGQSFLTDAIAILDHIDHALQRVKQKKPVSQLLISCDDVIHIPHFSDLLEQTRETLPGLSINLISTHDINKNILLNDESIDIAILHSPQTINMRGIQKEILSQSHFCCVMPRTHALAKEKQLTLKQLVNEALIFPSNYNCPPEFREMINNFQMLLTHSTISYAGTPSQAVSMSASGFGLSFMPTFVIPENADVISVPIVDTPIVFLTAAWRENNESEVLLKFVQILKEAFKKP